jgi:uncharacterized protein with PIN domain
MILDISALIAILRDEPDARIYTTANSAAVRRIPAVNYVAIIVYHEAADGGVS